MCPKKNNELIWRLIKLNQKVMQIIRVRMNQCTI